MKDAKYEEVIRLASKNLEARPEDAVQYYSRGIGLKFLGRLEKAAKDLRRSVDIDNKNPFALQGLAEALIRLKRYKDSLPYARRAASQRPQDPMFLHVLGLSELKTLHYAESVEAFRRLLELVPDEFEHEFWLSLAHFGLGQEADAESALQRFMEMLPGVESERARSAITMAIRGLEELKSPNPNLSDLLDDLRSRLDGPKVA
jgi:tetratricopeptide (TPR) repeat protein